MRHLKSQHLLLMATQTKSILASIPHSHPHKTEPRRTLCLPYIRRLNERIEEICNPMCQSSKQPQPYRKALCMSKAHSTREEEGNGVWGTLWELQYDIHQGDRKNLDEGTDGTKVCCKEGRHREWYCMRTPTSWEVATVPDEKQRWPMQTESERRYPHKGQDIQRNSNEPGVWTPFWSPVLTNSPDWPFFTIFSLFWCYVKSPLSP